MADESCLSNEPATESEVKLWDAIVVGAGPAGCAAAYDLAAGGLSVLLLDKKQFPRPKACAGGLTIKAVKALRYSIDPVVRQVVRRVLLASASEPDITLKSREPICVMTVRAELDEFCLRKTIAAGASFRRIQSIQQIARVGSVLHVQTAGERYRARFLIGADGASGQVRRLCAEGSWFRQGFALEVQVAHKATDLTFDFAAVNNGYGWIFPKGDHLNVGLYSQSSAGDVTRARLFNYVRDRLGAECGDAITGQYLGLGAGECPSDHLQQELRGHVFLVGDAGGFVDALTGEGIYGAVLSGQAAAHAVLTATRGEGSAAAVFAGDLNDYRQTLRFSSRAATAFYAQPARGFRVMRLPFLRQSLVRTYTHGLNINSVAMRIARAHG